MAGRPAGASVGPKLTGFAGAASRLFWCCWCDHPAPAVPGRRGAGAIPMVFEGHSRSAIPGPIRTSTSRRGPRLAGAECDHGAGSAHARRAAAPRAAALPIPPPPAPGDGEAQPAPAPRPRRDIGGGRRRPRRRAAGRWASAYAYGATEHLPPPTRPGAVFAGHGSAPPPSRPPRAPAETRPAPPKPGHSAVGPEHRPEPAPAFPTTLHSSFRPATPDDAERTAPSSTPNPGGRRACAHAEFHSRQPGRRPVSSPDLRAARCRPPPRADGGRPVTPTGSTCQRLVAAHANPPQAANFRGRRCDLHMRATRTDAWGPRLTANRARSGWTLAPCRCPHAHLPPLPSDRTMPNPFEGTVH